MRLRQEIAETVRDEFERKQTLDPMTRREWALPSMGTTPDQTEWNLLGPAYPPEKLAAILLPRSEWKPFPSAAERGSWESLLAADRDALTEDGSRNLKTSWPPLPATRHVHSLKKRKMESPSRGKP